MIRADNFAAILFDFDGTLAPNLDLPDMRRQVIELTQIQGVPEQVFADRYIVEVIEAAQDWLNQRETGAGDAYATNAHQLIYDIEINAAASTVPFPCVAEYLTKLQSAGVNMTVVTRNCREAVLKVFPELLTHIHVLRARDDVTHLKPDPRHLLTTLDELGHTAENAAMVGDGRLDMHCGKEAGLYCVGVESGSSDAKALYAAGADAVYENCLGFSAGQKT